MAVRDVLIIGVLLFTVAIGLFIINFASNTVIDSMVGIAEYNQSSDAVAALQNTQDKVINRSDYLIVGLFMGLALALIITGWFIGGNPIFSFIYSIIVILGVIFSSILAHIWQEITTASVFGTTVANFPISNHILSWLPMYLAIIGFIGLIVMFAKPYFSGAE